MSIVQAGTVLMQTGTPLPQSLQLEAAEYSKGWNLVEKLDGIALDGKLRKSNWNFIYISGKLEASVRGGWNGLTLRKAAIRLLAKAKLTQLNSVEITHVSKRQFLGFRYMRISGHSRHVQESNQLESLAERRLHLGSSIGNGTERR